jgi:transglutaminase-like putative cysteine protease
MKVYFSAKGDLLKVDGPMGIEMIPESREEAMAKPDAYKPTPDLAFSTSLKTDRPIPNPSKTTYLDLLVVGPDLSRVKSDDHQTVTREGEGWRVKVHPPRSDASPGATVAEAARLASAWTKPGLHIPNDSPRFRSLAARIVGPRKRVMEIARAVQDYVYGLMKPNAGIGVLRDANDVLDTKEGVCRDYAILTATILRAAGVPTRVASGLVNWDGDFFYHAWVEVFNGKQWIGVDSTTPSPQISATHVKLASGSVEDAFTFPFLERARLEIREVRPSR